MLARHYIDQFDMLSRGCYLLINTFYRLLNRLAMPENQLNIFENLVNNPTRPQSDAEWMSLDSAVMQLFTPHSPIDENALFAGRADIALEVIDIVSQRGCHGIIYGERGVGKTSLANIIRDRIFSRSRSFHLIKRNCTAQHNFALIWRHVLDEFDVEGKESREFVKDDVNAYDIYKILSMLEPKQSPIIVIDEFDRVSDPETFVRMADLIKLLADSGSVTTILVVGVGESVHQLFGGHLSIHRNVRQLMMPKMSRPELEQIFEKRLPVLGMNTSPPILGHIVDLSQGYPGYTHLISQFAFRAAVARRDLDVTELDLKLGIERCLERADEIVLDAYDKATRSTKSVHYYKEALTAFALTPTNRRGFFKAKDVREPFSKIMKQEMDIPNFSRHLKEFQLEDRGPVLIREGKPKTYEYKFANPLLKPFAIIAGIRDGVISMSDYFVS